MECAACSQLLKPHLPLHSHPASHAAAASQPLSRIHQRAPAHQPVASQPVSRQPASRQPPPPGRQAGAAASQPPPASQPWVKVFLSWARHAVLLCKIDEWTTKVTTVAQLRTQKSILLSKTACLAKSKKNELGKKNVWSRVARRSFFRFGHACRFA